MNDHEAQRIAAAAHQLRPDWHAASVLTLIRKNLADRPRRDVAVALAWIACEPNTATPARVLEAGPWWKAAGIEGTGKPLNRVERDQRCSICSERRERCQRLWAGDHDFESDVEAAKRHAESDPESLAAVVGALRDGIEATTAPAPRKSLDELAAADPALHEGWGEVRDGERVVACPACSPDAYEEDESNA